VATKPDLTDWVCEALRHYGGRVKLVDVAKYIWQRYQTTLEASGDFLFTWQYDMRWAANELRRRGVMRVTDVSPRGIWELV